MVLTGRYNSTMQINGIAHVQLTVSDFDAALPFYERLLVALGLTPVMRSEGFFYCVGGRTGVAISRAAAERGGEKFVQRRVGLHHVCFRARERADVDAVYALLLDMGAKIVHPPEDGPWAPGYYSVLFEDPDGIRLEVNHVPGKGLLAPGATAGA
jgi:catechol 2,3-dioxygenase-like lactoylglutathione lyase family enzyme